MDHQPLCNQISAALKLAEGKPRRTTDEVIADLEARRGPNDDTGRQWELMEQLECGGPFETLLSIENLGNFDDPQIKVNVRREQHDKPLPNEIMTCKVSISRAHMIDLAVEVFVRSLAEAQPAMLSLCILHRLDRTAFLETAATYFAVLLDDPTADARDDDRWLISLADLHERDAELIEELVARTILIQRAAGEALKQTILDALVESELTNIIGLLAAAQLREQLEG